MKHEKAPTARRFEGVLTISYMPMFWKITAFGHLLPTYGSRKCQKAHLQAKTFHMSLLPGLYDHPLQRYSLEKSMFRKTAIFGHSGQIWPFPVVEYRQNCQNAHLQVKTFHIPRSLRPSVTKKQQVNAKSSRHTSKTCFFL